MENGYDLFRTQAQKEPERIALVTAGTRWNMHELLERCQARYSGLAQSGLTSGNWIAVCLPDGTEAVLACLAAARIGAGALFLPPDTREEDLCRLGAHLPLHGCITTQGYAPLCLRGAESAKAPVQEVIFPTGGTSGVGKLVRISSQSLLNRAMVCHRYEESDPTGLKLSAIPPWHVSGMLELLRALLLERTAAIPSAYSVDGLLDCCRACPITNLVIPSTMLTRLLYHRNFSPEYFQALRILRYCLEPLPMETLMQTQALLPDVQLFSDYGLTEAVGTIAILGPDEHRSAQAHYLPSSGVFLPGVEAKVVDRHGESVASNTVGELAIHTPWQFIGYLGQPPSGYWLFTGDLVWVDGAGRFNLSGFHTAADASGKGDVYVLPAVARRKYINTPPILHLDSLLHQDRLLERFQHMLMLLHGSLDVEEIQHLYLASIPEVIEADAYGLELFPLDSKNQPLAIAGGDKWYQDAIRQLPRQNTLLSSSKTRGVSGGSLSLEQLERDFGRPADILYVPLYSRAACLHGAVSFARISGDRGFSPLEITLVKQISHHLNLALLNGRMHREIETRQAYIQRILDLSRIGTILSSRDGTIYYMNSVLEEFLDDEDVSPVRMSNILDKFQDHIRSFAQAEKLEHTSSLLCYFKQNIKPVPMTMRTVQLDPQSDFLATFLSSDLEQAHASFGSLDQSLTAREREVLTHLCHGLPYREIAQVMCISLNTVNFHVKQIYQKMEVNSRSELLHRVLYLGRNDVCYLPWTGGNSRGESL